MSFFIQGHFQSCILIFFVGNVVYTTIVNIVNSCILSTSSFLWTVEAYYVIKRSLCKVSFPLDTLWTCFSIYNILSLV